MNIKEAKEEICHTLLAYHKKDEDGQYCFPLLRQRPILLMGPPGIGKTAIMEQVAAECSVGLVSYTITHHTRQSAIGLPLIRQREFDGVTMDVTEYTMSEIIASVYECMEQTGKREGILFIDEINCVSETLAPIMLQFLQNKTFGSHKVPEGWMIIAAGNPPGYNKSVREFDIVTLDRVRKIEISPDCEVWLEYAVRHQVHGGILSYLGLKPEDFYFVENRPDGKFFVTARGWEDLSEILKSYEEAEIPVTEDLIRQYLQKEEVVRSFYVYYKLYCKYGMDYGIKEILNGEFSGEMYEARVSMACAGGFEERFTVVNLILNYLYGQITRYAKIDGDVTKLHEELQQICKDGKTKSLCSCLEKAVQKKQEAFSVKKEKELFAAGEERRENWVRRKLEDYLLELKQAHCDGEEQRNAYLKELFGKEVRIRKVLADTILTQMEEAFRFVERCFGDGQEMVLLVSGLARNEEAVKFFCVHECDAFLSHSKVLLFKKQEKSLIEECETMLKQ